jgi:hypothetical protein
MSIVAQENVVLIFFEDKVVGKLFSDARESSTPPNEYEVSTRIRCYFYSNNKILFLEKSVLDNSCYPNKPGKIHFKARKEFDKNYVYIMSQDQAVRFCIKEADAFATDVAMFIQRELGTKEEIKRGTPYR